MSEDDLSRLRVPGYVFVPARSICDGDLVKFAGAAWPARPPYERVLSRWWRHADPSCAVAAVDAESGAMAALCAARPSEWIIHGIPVTGRAICEWYVTRHHTGKGIGKRLVQHFTRPERFLYAFAVSEAAAVNFAKLGWKGPCASTLMALPLPRLARLPLALVPRFGGLVFEDHVVDSVRGLGTLAVDLDQIEATQATAFARMRRGAKEWAWRLTVCGERKYHVCVARREGAPLGYVVVRRMTPGASRLLGRREGAIIIDLVATSDQPAVLRALTRRAVTIAGQWGVVVVLMVTTVPAHNRALAVSGFLSSDWPVLSRALGGAVPIFMWEPQPARALLSADHLALTFADSDVDLYL
jgi:GNAT superfamily N-acetyltransferase